MTDLELAEKIRDAFEITCSRICVDDDGRVCGLDLVVNNKEEIGVRGDGRLLQFDEL